MKFKNKCLQNGLIDVDNFGLKLEFAEKINKTNDDKNINDIRTLHL